MEIKEIVENFKNKTNFSSPIFYEEDISSKTTFKIGGKAACYVEPEDVFQLQDLIALSKKYSIPFFILGGGSNIVFQDEYYDGIVISTKAFKGFSLLSCEDSQDCLVRAGSGEEMNTFVKFSAENNLWGAEKFSSLPGSVGGAVFMNARCFEKSVSEIFFSAYYLDLNTFECSEYMYNQEDWAYKKSPFQTKDKLVLQVVFKLKKGLADDSSEILKQCDFYTQERKSRHHFDFPSAGSVFKNNRAFGSSSGKIIDECHLCGKQIGGAQVAPFHGNFIINLGNATQKDVKSLVEFVVNSVRVEKGFTLEPEIIFV